MFRTSNQRGQNRFDLLRQGNFDKTGKVSLTPTQLKLIETSPVFALSEKIQLLLVALGHKLTTEVFMNVQYVTDSKKKIDLPNTADLEKIEGVLRRLPFKYFRDNLTRVNKNTTRKEDFHWFQVSINESVSIFMQQYPDDLTEFEEGVLYGFPLSAIRAFARLIEARHDSPNPATYHLAGWCSKDFWEDEQEYYQLWWDRLKQLSPKIVAEAEKIFYEESHSSART